MEQVTYALVDRTENCRESEDSAIVERLRRGDETAFTALVEQHHSALVRLAMCHVASVSTAEEVVQETWLALLEGLDRFEGRSSLKTWLYRILLNKAKDRGVREHRYVPLSTGHEDHEDDELAVDPSRFMRSDSRVGHWTDAPEFWDVHTPERLVLSRETGAYLEKAIADLPTAQRQVLVLHDIEGLQSTDICKILGVSQTNGYVLLHRARSRVRTALERYLKAQQPTPRPKKGIARRKERSAIPCLV